MDGKIFLVRHGEVSAEYRGRYIGSTDAPLDIDAAQNALLNLRRNLNGICRSCFCSPLKRAAATAENVFPDMKIVYDPRLREIDFGEWENLTFEEIRQTAGCKVIQRWCDAPDEMVFPGGESYPQFALRVDDFFNWILLHGYMAGNPCVVTHGGVIMRAMEKFLQIPHAESIKWLPPRGEMRILTLASGELTDVQ